MLNKIRENLQIFFVIWGAIIFLNQILIFGGCFASYCLIAALPHTGFIAALIIYLINKDENDSNEIETRQKSESLIKLRRKKEVASEDKNLNTSRSILEEKDTYLVDKIEEDEVDDIEEVKEPYCPKCGSKMVLRTAKNGRYAGNNFWGCSKFPQCKSIINI